MAACVHRLEDPQRRTVSFSGRNKKGEVVRGINGSGRLKFVLTIKKDYATAGPSAGTHTQRVVAAAVVEVV